jgi:hypothetical protein
MAVPWLRILDMAIGAADIARAATGSRGKDEPPPDPDEQLDLATRSGPGLEARLAGVVVAALKEAFDRDTRRVDLERQHLAAERERAERALRLELQRQAGEREIGRLRLLAGVAVVAWIGSLALSARFVGGAGARVTLGFGWVFLLSALAASFVAQSGVSTALGASALDDEGRREIRSGASGAAALWLTILGLVLVALAALIA